MCSMYLVVLAAEAQHHLGHHHRRPQAAGGGGGLRAARCYRAARRLNSSRFWLRNCILPETPGRVPSAQRQPCCHVRDVERLVALKVLLKGEQQR